jgi:ribosomal protein L39E
LGKRLTVYPGTPYDGKPGVQPKSSLGAPGVRPERQREQSRRVPQWETDLINETLRNEMGRQNWRTHPNSGPITAPKRDKPIWLR